MAELQKFARVEISIGSHTQATPKLKSRNAAQLSKHLGLSPTLNFISSAPSVLLPTADNGRNTVSKVVSFMQAMWKKTALAGLRNCNTTISDFKFDLGFDLGWQTARKPFASNDSKIRTGKPRKQNPERADRRMWQDPPPNYTVAQKWPCYS